jgi:outer membrane lipoprotein SlyB
MGSAMILGRLGKARLGALLGVALLVQGCATTGGPMANTANLTPAQRQLRDQDQRWWQTTATGAVSGAALGAVAGAAFGGRNNRGEAALIGALIGGIAGTMAGATMANRTLEFENREASAHQRIASAQQAAASFEQAAMTAKQVTDENSRRLEALDRQYRARQITAEQYRRAAAPIQQDKELMERAAGDARSMRERMVGQRDALPGITSAEARIGPAQRSLEASAAQLDDLLRRVPPG